ncbi:5-bromo-4-chloroindolyl phosphate hydrolysis family protein [Blautia sp. An81]|uniref:5-bromo-4-chloroindolyl phosphate hydrolysis family protein n=1 Tax=Blautia sp. An81 TaxID=1965659 RepID=UPI000B38C60A|nr:5-bromo-4-chloroindolyl phosphate hydrolysis family protein [Blautia sp. An81]OUN30485.1 hypothetical protein B5G33_08390 [Blautia sp. An81]
MMRKETVRSILCGLTAGALFLGVFLGMGWNFFVSVFLAAGLFAGLLLITKPREIPGKLPLDMRPDGAYLEKRLEEAREDFESIRQSVEKIQDQGLRENSERLYKTSSNILAYLEKNPDKISGAGRFIDYYQDTASSLLKKYVELQNSGLETPEARSLKEDTKKAMFMLNQAFEQQFQRLMRNELMDMDVEIQMIENMMKMEGPL